MTTTDSHRREHRRLFWWVRGDVVVSILVGLAVLFISGQQTHSQEVSQRARQVSQQAIIQAEANRIATYQSCLIGNQFRSDNAKLWQQVIALIPPSNPKSAAFDRTVLSIAGRTFMPRDCGPNPQGANDAQP